MAYTLAYAVHPGEIIREEILPQYQMNITEAAKLLHAARPNLSNVLNEKAGVSAALALKIEAAFGFSAKILVAMQATYDLANAQEHKAEILEGVVRAKVPEHA